MSSSSAERMTSAGEQRCPVCESLSTVFLFSADAEVFECRDCSHVFSSLPSIKSMEGYGPDYYEEVHENWFKNPNTRLFEWIRSNLPVNCTSVLDVGCGKGAFLRFLRDRSSIPLRLVGIDYSPNAPERGIEYREGAFEDMRDIGLFDASVNLAVIEHLVAPVEFVRYLFEHCAEKGVVIVMTINNDSILYCVARLLARMGMRGPMKRLYSSHHLQHFTRASLERTLEKAGFRVFKARNHNAPLRAIDIPTRNRALRTLLAAGVGVVFLIGTAVRRTYLQTVIASPIRPGPDSM